MIGIPLGLLAANATEWVVHKYVLHDLGRNRDSFWAFHWHDHHRACRRHGHHDPAYDSGALEESARRRETGALIGAAIAVTPLLPIAPFFTATLYYSAVHYYRVHKRAHLDPDWAREHLPWHYDHHMGPNQDANWCVTRPWFDHLMGTREPYVGTESERRDRSRREARRARAAARASDAPSPGPAAAAA